MIEHFWKSNENYFLYTRGIHPMQHGGSSSTVGELSLHSVSREPSKLHPSSCRPVILTLMLTPRIGPLNEQTRRKWSIEVLSSRAANCRNELKKTSGRKSSDKSSVCSSSLFAALPPESTMATHWSSARKRSITLVK